jgi:hypothetical protein
MRCVVVILAFLAAASAGAQPELQANEIACYKGSFGDCMAEGIAEFMHGFMDETGDYGRSFFSMACQQQSRAGCAAIRCAETRSCTTNAMHQQMAQLCDGEKDAAACAFLEQAAYGISKREGLPPHERQRLVHEAEAWQVKACHLGDGRACRFVLNRAKDAKAAAAEIVGRLCEPLALRTAPDGATLCYEGLHWVGGAAQHVDLTPYAAALCKLSDDDCRTVSLRLAKYPKLMDADFGMCRQARDRACDAGEPGHGASTRTRTGDGESRPSKPAGK